MLSVELLEWLIKSWVIVPCTPLMGAVIVSWLFNPIGVECRATIIAKKTFTPLMGGSDNDLAAEVCEHNHGGEGKKTFGGEKLKSRSS